MTYFNPYSDDKFYFFWSGPLSQWAIRPMTVDDVAYNCCEQYMMAGKAKLFGDDFILSRLMAEHDPKKQKSLGRLVMNFDKEKWESVARKIVCAGNYAKFTQHGDLLEELRATGDRIIVEASPHDKIWGIGLKASDSRAKDQSKWPGKNWLGECLMRVRDRLLEEGKL